MTKRAILLSGGVRQTLNHARYENDVAAYYRMLVNVYHYDPAEITVLVGPGGARPIVPGGPIAGAATRDRVIAALERLRDLGEEDRALLMFTDHGDPEEGVALWGKGAFLSAAEVESLVGVSPATKVLILGQCSAGSFGSLNLGRAIVCSACGPGENSFPCYVAGRGEEPLYNEFLYQMAGALTGQYPDGQSLLDPGLTAPPAITLDEAFRYARDHDRWVTGTRGAAELPRMFDPHGIATTMTL